MKHRIKSEIEHNKPITIAEAVKIFQDGRGIVGYATAGGHAMLFKLQDWDGGFQARFGFLYLHNPEVAAVFVSQTAEECIRKAMRFTYNPLREVAAYGSASELLSEPLRTLRRP